MLTYTYRSCALEYIACRGMLCHAMLHVDTVRHVLQGVRVRGGRADDVAAPAAARRAGGGGGRAGRLGGGAQAARARRRRRVPAHVHRATTSRRLL